MNRHALAVATLLLLRTAPVFAQHAGQQTAEMVVKSTAAIHKSPTTASAIVGQAPRGTTLPVNRNLGSWVEVSWPEAAAGIAYVHVSAGVIAPQSTAPATNGARAAIAEIAAVAAAASATADSHENPRGGALATQSGASARPAAYASLPQHRVGIGALLNTSTLRFGGAARTWFNRRLGVEFSMTRPELASPDGQLIPSTQLAPSVLYSLPEGISDSMWVRPFVGGGPRFYRANLETGRGYEAFAGVETTLAAIPQFALSAETGYRWARPSLSGFMPRQIAFSLAGHFYVK